MQPIQIAISDRTHLRSVLEQYNQAHVGQWEEKVFDELFDQVMVGTEAVLWLYRNRILRDVHRSQVLAFHKKEGEKRYEFLKEGTQRFDDHRRRNRRKGRMISFSEKRRREHETFPEAAVRGALEELRDPDDLGFRVVLNPSNLVPLGMHLSRPRPSKTFRGLLTRSTIERFGCFFTEAQYRPAYVEYDDGKITTCRWEPWKGKLPAPLQRVAY